MDLFFTKEVFMKIWITFCNHCIIRTDPAVQPLLLFTVACSAVFVQEAQFGGRMETPISTSSLQVVEECLQGQTNF